MAAFDHTKPQRIELGLGRLVSRIAGAVMFWGEARRTRDALERLSDRELDDIGLTRHDILRVSRGEMFR